MGTAVGYNAKATGNLSTAIGVNSEASDSNATAIGLGSKATKVDEIDRRGRRGAAIAAMELLPQPRTNGKSTISTAAIHYRSEQALVVGYSHVTDNGKHIIKLSGASNMSGKKDVMLGAAYGYE
ncbi:TPA: YadA-like family protein [Haemophilus influenzae]